MDERELAEILTVDTGLLLVVSHRFSSDRGKLLENVAFLDLRRDGCEIYCLMDKKAREVDGLRLAMRRFDPDRGLAVTPDQCETMPVSEGGIEFLPYRRWALETERWCG